MLILLFFFLPNLFVTYFKSFFFENYSIGRLLVTFSSDVIFFGEVNSFLFSMLESDFGRSFRQCIVSGSLTLNLAKRRFLSKFVFQGNF